MSNFIPYGKHQITEEDIQAVTDVLRSSFITQGPVIQQFEEKLCQRFGCKYAIAVNSGTAALHAAYFAAGITVGDEIITTPNTFVATSNAALYLGATPIFSEIEKDTGNIDSLLIEEKVNSDTKAIVPVHYAGHPADMKHIRFVADKYNLMVIEDAAHAVGARYNSNLIGDCSFSDIVTFSFHPVKHVATGEGGAVLTNNEKIYQKALQFRNHGITKEHLNNESQGPWYYEMQHLGFNYRITDIQCGLGISQLQRLDENLERRNAIFDHYREKLDGNPWFHLPVERNYVKSSWHLYPVRLKEHLVDKKADIFQLFFENGIGVQTHYIPVYTQPYYQKNGYDDLSLPNAEAFYKSEISLPMYHALQKEEQEKVIRVIEKVFKKFKR